MAIPTKNKYGARKLTAPDGQKFDSVKEYHRWGCLRLLERAGKISDLKRQVSFELIPKQDGERACTYVTDFTYYENGQYVVEDCKGFKTDVYRIKKKLMKWVHGISITET
jgi:hypothetical protein